LATLGTQLEVGTEILADEELVKLEDTVGDDVVIDDVPVDEFATVTAELVANVWLLV